MKIYTDGSAELKTGRGGCAAVFVDDDGEVVNVYRKQLTNTKTGRAEINALILALEQSIELGLNEILVHSDSQYVVKTINEGWYKRWILVRDTTKANMDLWGKVFELLPKVKRFQIKHVKGHAGNIYNELADIYASYKFEDSKAVFGCKKGGDNCSKFRVDKCISSNNCKNKIKL